VKRTLRPWWQAQTASAVASIVLPVPESPIKMPLAEPEVGGDDQRAALVALGENLEDELGSAVGAPFGGVKQSGIGREGRALGSRRVPRDQVRGRQPLKVRRAAPIRGCKATPAFAGPRPPSRPAPLGPAPVPPHRPVAGSSHFSPQSCGCAIFRRSRASSSVFSSTPFSSATSLIVRRDSTASWTISVARS